MWQASYSELQYLKCWFTRQEVCESFTFRTNFMDIQNQYYIRNNIKSNVDLQTMISLHSINLDVN